MLRIHPRACLLAACLALLFSLDASRASGQAPAALGACQKAMAKESTAYTRSLVQMVDKCLSRISSGVVQNGVTVAAAAGREASYCATAFARLGDTGAAKELGVKFDTRVARKCDAPTFAPSLGAANLDAYCETFGGDGSVDSLAEWQTCVRAGPDADARDAIATRWPRALEYFAGLATAIDALPPSDATTAAHGALLALDAAIEGPVDDDQPDPRTGPAGLIATGIEQDFTGDACERFCLPDHDGRVQAGHAARLRDDGDGTITDEVSGLTWEKLSNDGSIHERSAAYSFADAIDVKIAALNAGSGFAGHTDWRLPNRRELESLVDASRTAPAIREAFADACPSGCSILECSCTFPDVHWTSTSYQPDASARWVVDFQTGAVSPTTRELAHVRAVRGGARVAAPPTPGTGSGNGTKGLATCQKTVAKESVKYVSAVVGTIGKCLDRMTTEVIVRGATVPDAARAAGASCVAALRKIENATRPDAELGARFDAKVADKCDPAVNADLSHADADTWTIGTRTLGAARLAAYCTQLGGDGTIDGFADWSACLRRAADAEARQAIALRWPRALEYFAALEAEMAMLPASVETSDARAALLALDGQIEGVLDDDRPDPLPEPAVGLLETGQTQCAQDDLTMGPCPGALPGQDGAVRASVARSYTDNGDGTITDHVTELTWEKLSDDDSINDKDHFYSYPGLFLNKVKRLNRHRFAGHDDWRVPNRRELESLVDAGRSSPAIDPIFDQDCTPGCSALECSCTHHVDQADGLGRYASSSVGGDRVWAVDFRDGRLEPGSGFLVRAVRGGPEPLPRYVNQRPTAFDIDVKHPWKTDCIPVTLLGSDPDSYALFPRIDTFPQNGFLVEWISAIPAAFPDILYWGPSDAQELNLMGGPWDKRGHTLCYVTLSPTFTGTDSFTYHVMDDEGLHSTVATATITIFEVP